jgi:two-component system NarL family response regulator
MRVMLVEDHYLARLAVHTLVSGQEDMQVVAEAENGQQAIEKYAECKPDLVVMDLRLPGVDGVAATRAICRNDPNARILLLSHYETEEDVRRAMEAGARGYLKKDVKGTTLLGAIRLVAEGHRYLPAAFAVDPDAQTAKSPLSPRETEILELVFKGSSNRDVAQALSITEGTVRIHISNILHKLGVKRRTEAVAEALKRGILRLVEP